MCQSLRVGCMDIFVLLVDEGAVPAVCVEREGMSVNVSVECERGRYGDTETERHRYAETQAQQVLQQPHVLLDVGTVRDTQVVVHMRVTVVPAAIVKRSEVGRGGCEC